MTTYGVNINDRFKRNENTIKAHAVYDLQAIKYRQKLKRWHLVSLAVEDWVKDIKAKKKEPVEMMQEMVRGYVDMIYVMNNPQRSTIVIEDAAINAGITRIYNYLLKYKAGKWKMPLIKINGKPNIRMVIWLAVDRYAAKLRYGDYSSR